jgi:hypothetical protein
MHKVIVNRAQALISVTASGFFDAAGLATAAADLHAAVRSLGARAGRHVTLYDLSGLKVAAPGTLDRFAAYWSKPEVELARRVALVTASPMVRLQMDRVSRVRDTLRVFDDRRDALGWLLADTERLAA